MTDNQEIVVLSALRSAIGSFGGGLREVPPSDLAATVARAAVERAGVPAEAFAHSIWGHIINTEPKDMYLSRIAALGAGLPETVAAMNVNRLCGSGAEAIVSAARMLACGEGNFALAGGAEVMSRAPHALPAARWGQKMGDVRALDMLLGTLHCPFGSGHMGCTAENVAERHGISRADQDAFALESQHRALTAIAEGRFADRIVPIEVQSGRATVVFDTDEHPRETTLEALAELPPVFRKGGTVTAGNASGINDGAAAVVLARAGATRAAGLEPEARILGWAHAGVSPEVMGIGPVPAVRRLLSRTGLSVDDFAVIESNEAFAAQAIAVSRALGFPPERVNPNGGAIALGHPVGATGAILVVKAIGELRRRGGGRALVTLCIGGGQGIALALEAL